MNLKTIIQIPEKEMDITDLEKEVKEKIKNAGIKLTKVDAATAYVNVFEGKTYVVVETEGKIVEL